jgi:hypothetical protein
MKPPDLDAPHTAVSLHFKNFDAQPAYVWNAKLDEWCDITKVETKVAIYFDAHENGPGCAHENEPPGAVAKAG